MISKRLGVLCAALGLTCGLGGCVDDYGYGGMSVGYGAGYYGDPYYDGFGYGGLSNYGWYGDYYYPGTGIYEYDSYRRPYRWTDSQRRYWSARQRYRGSDWNGQGRWNGFDRRPGVSGDRPWQGDRNGVTPGGRDWRDGRRDGDRTVTPRPGGDGGRWRNRSAPDGATTTPQPGAGRWQGWRNGGGGTTEPGAGRWQGWRNGGTGATQPGAGRWRGPSAGTGATAPAPRSPGGWQGRGGGGRSGGGRSRSN
jgi:hypothetical protein